MYKVLITYYSELGSTKEIASIASNQFKTSKVDLLDVRDVENLDYDVIIIGSPNKYGRPVSEIQKFLKRNATQLETKAIHFFFTCLDCYIDTRIEKYAVDVFIDSHFSKTIHDVYSLNSWQRSHSAIEYIDFVKILAPSVTIASVAFFKGRLELCKLNLFDKLIMKCICLLSKNIKEGDFYKKKDVESWINQTDFFLLN